MKRRLLIALILLTLVLPLAGVARAQNTRPIQSDCCALVYSTGRWLGWAASLLRVTRIRTRPDRFDRIILDCLSNVNPNVQRSNQQCSQRLPAWPGWRNMQQWINIQIRELQTPSTSIKSHHTRRNQVWRNIEHTYASWGNILSVQGFNGRRFKQTTCSTCYFRLGFDTAYAVQAFRQAQEAFRFGNIRGGQIELNQARSHLQRAMNVFKSYHAIQRRSSFRIRCVNLSNLNAEARISRIARTALNQRNFLWYMNDAIRISDGIGQVLRNGCIGGGGGGGGGGGLTNITVNRNTITVSIWDFSAIDGDRVDLFLNGHLIGRNITLKKRKSTFSLRLSRGINTLEVKALNEGSSSPNTASMEISNVVTGKRNQKWRLKTGQTGSMKIRFVYFKK